MLVRTRGWATRSATSVLVMAAAFFGRGSLTKKLKLLESDPSRIRIRIPFVRSDPDPDPTGEDLGSASLALLFGFLKTML